MFDHEDDDDVELEAFGDPSPAPELDDQLARLCDALAQTGLTRVAVFYERRGKNWRLTKNRYRPKGVPVAAALTETLRTLAEGYCRRAFNLDGTADLPRCRTTSRRGTLTLYPCERRAKLSDAESSQETEMGPCRTFALPARLRRQLAALGVTTVTVSFTLSEHVGHVKKLTTQPAPVAIEGALRKEVEEFVFKHLPTSLIIKDIGWTRSTQGFGTVEIDVEESLRQAGT